MAPSRRRFLTGAAAMGGAAALGGRATAWHRQSPVAGRQLLPVGPARPARRGPRPGGRRGSALRGGTDRSPDAVRGRGAVLVHRPAQLGTVGRRRPEGRRQPDYGGEECRRSSAGAQRPARLDEPRLRAVAAVPAQERPGRRVRRGRRLLRLHLPRPDDHAHRRAVPHVGRRRHVAGARPGRGADHAGRGIRRHRRLERRHRHPRRADRRAAPTRRVARDAGQPGPRLGARGGGARPGRHGGAGRRAARLQRARALPGRRRRVRGRATAPA